MVHEFYANLCKANEGKKIYFKRNDKSLRVTKAMQILGLSLLNGYPEYRNENEKNLWHFATPITYGSKRHTYFLETFGEDLFTTQTQDLLWFFFSDEIAPLVLENWNKLNDFIYQTGTHRRSFRRPNHPDYNYVRNVNFLIHCITTLPLYDLTIAERLENDAHIGHVNEDLAYLLLATDKQWEHTFLDIIYNRHPKIKISTTFIKVLLSHKNPEYWQAIGDLLLSAQRQEGLRQSILEAADYGQLGAFKYLIGLILTNKLTRFSATLRAIETWIGLGWQAEKEGTIKRFLELGYRFLEKPDSIPAAITAKDNAEVYMALWAQGVINVDACIPLLDTLWKSENLEKQCLALIFAGSTQLHQLQNIFFSRGLASDNLQCLAFTFQYTQANTTYSTQERKSEFQQLETVLSLLANKEPTFNGKVFAWTRVQLTKTDVYRRMLAVIDKSKPEEVEWLLPHYDAMDGYERERLAEIILKDFFSYHWEQDKKVKEETITTSLQRNFAFRAVLDRNVTIQQSAIRTIKCTEITEDEIEKIEALLTRKSAKLRQSIIDLLLTKETSVMKSIERLLFSNSTEQRLAALDMMWQLQKQNKHQTAIDILTQKLQDSQQVTSQEEVLLQNLLGEGQKYTEKNGFGLYDPSISTSLPKITVPVAGPFFEKRQDLYQKKFGLSILNKLGISKNMVRPYGLSKSVADINADLEKLKEIFLAHQDHEYTIESYGAVHEKVLLGNVATYTKSNYDRHATEEERFEQFPLHNIWHTWMQETNLNTFDIFTISKVTKNNLENSLYQRLGARAIEFFPKTAAALAPIIANIHIPALNQAGARSYSYQLTNIINALCQRFPYEDQMAYEVGEMEYAIAHIAPKELYQIQQTKEGEYGGSYWALNVFELPTLRTVTQFLHPKDEALFTKMYAMYRLHDTVVEKTNRQLQNSLPRMIFIDFEARAFALDLITKDELVCRLMNPDIIRQLTTPIPKEESRRQTHPLVKYPFLENFVQPIRDRILDIELQRGDKPTIVSIKAQNIQRLYGQAYFFKIVNALGNKGSLHRGYVYTYGTTALNKQQMLSRLLKHCQPEEHFNQDSFNTAAEKMGYSAERWVAFAMYAQQWAPHIRAYLGWEGMESAIWWLHAHTNAHHSNETESEIARFTAMKMSEFADGGVDVNWFFDAHQQLGKARWEVLYDAAKYISNGQGHNRAKLYADVLLGNTKIREVTKQVKDKRDKDYMRIYGLVPLSKSIPEKDLLDRYLYIQQFIKESRQFGAQRQESEGLAAQIALENLARTAGYPDPMRLTWTMESTHAQTIIKNAEPLVLDNGTYAITLKIDSDGKPYIENKNNNRVLKKVPAKFNKNKQVIALKEQVNQLRAQHSRARKSLEEAMVRQDEFLWKEILVLLQNPVISPLIQKLVLHHELQFGFPIASGLQLLNGEIIELPIDTKVTIAHVTQLDTAHCWTAFQQYCFTQQITQPFKQVFRELYVPTADELGSNTISNRYAGHQVQPQKTIEILKERGWRVNYEDGLQKVYHKECIAAKIYALANWFTPADIESPALETIQFHSTKTYRNIPFSELPATLFSEVMRDIDLVVSVAHVGDVDPESSQSSMELRGALVTETAHLLKLDNVHVEGSHVHITGTLGDYSIHLGSAQVFQKPGRHLGVIPVHSQHRGRLFLPFADDDPKSAELLAKVILFAEDRKIQDPTILEQIKT